MYNCPVHLWGSTGAVWSTQHVHVRLLCTVWDLFKYISLIVTPTRGTCLAQCSRHTFTCIVRQANKHKLDVTSPQSHCWEAPVPLRCFSMLIDWATEVNVMWIISSIMSTCIKALPLNYKPSLTSYCKTMCTLYYHFVWHIRNSLSDIPTLFVSSQLPF